MRNITTVGLRLLGLWFILQSTNLLISNYSILLQPGNQEDVLSMISQFLIGFILLVSATKAAKIIAPNNDSVDIKIDNYEKFSAAVFSGVGFYIVLSSVISLIYNGYSILFYMGMNNFRSEDFLPPMYLLIIGGGVQLILGLVLFIGGKKIAKWWYSFRNWS